MKKIISILALAFAGVMGVSSANATITTCTTNGNTTTCYTF